MKKFGLICISVALLLSLVSCKGESLPAGNQGSSDPSSSNTSSVSSDLPSSSEPGVKEGIDDGFVRKITPIKEWEKPTDFQLIESKIIEGKEFGFRDVTLDLYAQEISTKEEQLGIGGVHWSMVLTDGENKYILMDNTYVKDVLVDYYPVLDLDSNAFFIAVNALHSSVGVSITEFRYDSKENCFNEYLAYSFAKDGNPNILNKADAQEN